MDERYSADQFGFYNTEVFQKSGQKFRPIDIDRGRIVIVTPALESFREKFRRGSLNVRSPITWGKGHYGGKRSK